MKVEGPESLRIHVGSLQRKGKWFYLVCWIDGRQKWRALHTCSRRSAYRRARELCYGRQDVDERAWLLTMVRQGEKAKSRLSYLETCECVNWENLWSVFLARIAPERISPSGEISYRRWLIILAERAIALSARSPAALRVEEARQITSALCVRYVAVSRMVRFFRRVWTSLGLDAKLWMTHPQPLQMSRRFRRLSFHEIVAVLDWLLARQHIDLAEVLQLGYYTGLRLSDICELDVAEVAEDGAFLSLVPNKVRERKKSPLLIPLVAAARAIVQRRVKACSSRLFPELPSPREVSKRFQYAFAAAGVHPNEIGRASFHSLRATFISLMDEAGIPPYLTDSITGHGGGTLHARYTQPSRAALAAAVRKALPDLSPPQEDSP